MSVDIYIQWDSYSQSKGVYAIPKYLESNAELIRSRFLEFIYELGKHEISGKSLERHLEVVPGFSIWWMGLLFEKSFYKTETVENCLKIIALEDFLVKKKLKQVLFRGVDKKEIKVVITKLCLELDIEANFIECESNLPVKREGVRAIYRRLPYMFQGIISLIRHLVERWSLRKLNPAQWFNGENSVFFFSYFLHLDPEHAGQNQFYSRQWEILPRQLTEKGFKTNWIHHFQKSMQTPHVDDAIRYAEGFNSDAAEQGRHTLLDAYLSVQTVMQALRHWTASLFKSFLLSPDIKNIFVPKGARADLWPLFKDDWYRSVRGSIAMQNCLWISMFDVAMRDLPYQPRGFYLYEGMGWERAFVYAWRKHHHGALTGVFHSSLRFWDLRWISDPRMFLENNLKSFPFPDKFAVNGPVAWDAFVRSGYPEALLVEVEAVRYLNVINQKMPHPEPSIAQEEKSKKRLLVLGDIIPSATMKMMEDLQSLPDSFLDGYSITVKPHPAYAVGKKDYPRLDFQLSNESLHMILHEFDCVYGANSTSANLDAYLTGLPVIVHISSGELVTSPLRAMKGVIFVTTPDELETAISNINFTKATERKEYFWGGSSLPRWNQLMAQDYG